MENKLIVPIKGMHCRSCEVLVEEELGALKGVKSVKSDWRRGEAEITYHGSEPAAGEVSSALRRVGYSVGRDDQKGFLSRDREDYRDLGVAFLFLVILYFAWQFSGLGKLQVNSSAELSAPLVLAIGLVAGFSTCMALVGGLVLGISARYSEKHPEATRAEKFYPQALFNFGRVIGFGILGGILGILGSAFQMSATLLGIISIIIGLVMIGLGLQLVGIFPWAEKLKFTLPKGMARRLGGSEEQKKEYSPLRAFLLGALTFFLPCGFTQAMQAFAISTGSFWSGAIIMSAFALGTVPGLLGVGALTAAAKGNFARRFFKLAGLAVLIFAVSNILRGCNLATLSVGAPAPVKTEVVRSTEKQEAQIVRMTEDSYGYSPDSFTVKKGVPVRWIINATEPYSCASSILFPEYGIRKILNPGENIIEFTPTRSGNFHFSCSMGMYSGSFTVTD